MSPKASAVCSCGGKLKTGTALADHLKQSPKHKKSLIKGKAVPKPPTSKETSVAINTKPEGSAFAGPAAVVTTKDETAEENLERINAKVKETQRVHDILEAKLRELLELEITNELKHAIKNELKPLLKRELEAEIKFEFGDDLKKLKAEMMADLISEIKSDFKNTVKEEIKNEFRMTVSYQLSSKTDDEIKTEPIDDLRSNLKAELRSELMEEFKSIPKPESNVKPTEKPKGDHQIYDEYEFLTEDEFAMVRDLPDFVSNRGRPISNQRI
ncbi:hypothetical protein V491_08042 [Pseudogymnoascus sp. VKM F-3775]|nr:hypothetical protein V491_08042 [Pseudogymnoascus sp. VKM F-3775]